MLEHIAILLVLLYSLVYALLHFYLFNSKSTGLLLSTANAVAGNVDAGPVVGIKARALLRGGPAALRVDVVALLPPVLTALFNRPASAPALQISLPASILSSLVFISVNEKYAFLVGD